MTDVMTDLQMEFIANLIADKFDRCQTLEEVKKEVKNIRYMASKNKLINADETQNKN
ncbi:MAG: hypothetical protein FWF82_03675 [Oscillospiraceae bacterium]|nr:hypothetical protein [Oscillospiraceae bacterium]